MFRMWARLYKDGRCVGDAEYEDGGDKSRTAKVFAGIEEFCRTFDLAKPIWLDKNVSEFKKHDKTSFNKDNFIESIPFDHMRIEVIEEDP
ncbi:MAG: hypothetical protein J6U10_00210 [Lachnospiraceae bacterium]|nr:hypothetical protein [Lachnospiraceae bacterium]MBP5185075.1 hypothetical protein [Lachnospiraceae bacterium]